MARRAVFAGLVTLLFGFMPGAHGLELSTTVEPTTEAVTIDEFLLLSVAMKKSPLMAS